MMIPDIEAPLGCYVPSKEVAKGKETKTYTYFKLTPDHPLDDTLTELCRLRDKAIRKKTKNKYRQMIWNVYDIINRDNYSEDCGEITSVDEKKLKEDQAESLEYLYAMSRDFANDESSHKDVEDSYNMLLPLIKEDTNV